MCVIINKPKSVKMPDIETLRACYMANQDGMGFCTSTGRNLHTMSFNKFVEELSKVDDSEEVIMHFRFATHGTPCKRNCHPFYDRQNGVWFAHNGVLPIMSKHNRTDSEIFFRERFVPALNVVDYDDEILWDWVEQEREGSRFIFMKDGKVKRLGDWYEHDGCYYSNLHWYYYTRVYKPYYSRRVS